MDLTQLKACVAKMAEMDLKKEESTNLDLTALYVGEVYNTLPASVWQNYNDFPELKECVDDVKMQYRFHVLLPYIVDKFGVKKDELINVAIADKIMAVNKCFQPSKLDYTRLIAWMPTTGFYQAMVRDWLE